MLDFHIIWFNALSNAESLKGKMMILELIKGMQGDNVILIYTIVLETKKTKHAATLMHISILLKTESVPDPGNRLCKKQKSWS